VTTKIRELAPWEVDIPDGPRVLVRPLDSGDRERVRRAYALLSPDSRMNRFWQKSAEMSESRATSLTETDAREHVAWAALPLRDGKLPGYAGASFWRAPEAPERAELAFTVADPWRRHGFATLLFSVLWIEGWELGVREFFGFCRPANRAMIAWWESVGGEVEPGGRQVELRLSLESPETFVQKVAFEMPPSPRRVETAEWIRYWSEEIEARI